MPRQSVAVLAFSPIRRDARVLRHAWCLSQRYRVTVVGYGDDDVLPIRGVDLIRLEQPRSQGLAPRLATAARLGLARALSDERYERVYWSYPVYREARRHLLDLQPSIILANDWNAVPAAAEAADATGAGLVVDFHEFGPRQWDNSFLWRTFKAPMADYIVRRYVDRSTPTMTVCPSLAQAYERSYGFAPDVVFSAPRLTTLPDFEPTDPDRIRMVHHGVAARVRRLETMVEAVAQAGGRYTLDLMLVGSDRAYVRELEDLGARLAPGRVRIAEPVPPEQIVDRIAGFDVGFFLLPPTTFNYAHALPNKFFDFMAAGLAVAIGPTPDMAAIATEGGFGIVSDDFRPAAMAAALRAQTAEGIDEKRQSARRAAASYNADVECAKLHRIVEGVAG